MFYVVTIANIYGALCHDVGAGWKFHVEKQRGALS